MDSIKVIAARLRTGTQSKMAAYHYLIEVYNNGLKVKLDLDSSVASAHPIVELRALNDIVDRILAVLRDQGLGWALIPGSPTIQVGPNRFLELVANGRYPRHIDEAQSDVLKAALKAAGLKVRQDN